MVEWPSPLLRPEEEAMEESSQGPYTANSLTAISLTVPAEAPRDPMGSSPMASWDELPSGTSPSAGLCAGIDWDTSLAVDGASVGDDLEVPGMAQPRASETQLRAQLASPPSVLSPDVSGVAQLLSEPRALRPGGEQASDGCFDLSLSAMPSVMPSSMMPSPVPLDEPSGMPSITMPSMMPLDEPTSLIEITEAPSSPPLFASVTPQVATATTPVPASRATESPLLRGVLDPADAALAVPSGFAVSTNDTGPVAFIPKARVVREDVPLAGSYVPPSAVGRLVGDDICAICLEPLRTQAQTIALCGHVFHRSCLNASRSSVCPQCRQPIDVEEAAFGSMHGNISLGGSLPSQISRPRREHRQHGNGHSHSGQQHSNNPSSWRSAGRTAGRTAAQEESFTAAVDSSLARVNSAALGGSRNGHQRARTGSPSIARGDGRRPLSLAAFADGLAMLSATLSSERSRATQLSSLISALARHSEGATSSLEGRTGTSGSGAFGTASGLLTGIDSTDIGHSARHYSGHSEHGITGVDAPFGENAARAGGHLESQSSMNVASYAAHSPRLSRRATRNSRSADPIRSLDMAGLGDLSELGSLLGAAASLRDLANVSELQQGLGARHNPLESRSTQEVQPDGHVSLGAVPMVPHYIGSYGSSGSYVLPVAASASPDASLSRAVARFAFFADGPVPGVGPITSPGLAHAETQGPRSVCNQPRPRSFGPGLQQHPQQVVPQLTIPHLPLGSIPTAHADGRADDGMGLGTGGEPSSAHPCLTDVPDTLPSCLAARLELQVNRDGSARLLGQGAYAIVCRVSERATGLTRALKVMARQPLAIRGLEDQAHREMTLQQDLRHPHILRIYDAVEANGHFYMLSEYAAFGSLQQLAGRAPWRRLYQPTAAFFSSAGDNGCIVFA